MGRDMRMFGGTLLPPFQHAPSNTFRPSGPAVGPPDKSSAGKHLGFLGFSRNFRGIARGLNGEVSMRISRGLNSGLNRGLNAKICDLSSV